MAADEKTRFKTAIYQLNTMESMGFKPSHDSL